MTTEVKEIKSEVLAIADQLRKSVEISDAGKVTFAADAFKTALPEELSTDTIRKVEHFKQDFAAAQTLVTGELAAKYFKDNSSADAVKSMVRLPVGASIAVVQRETTLRNPVTGEETKVHNHASTRIAVKVPASLSTAVRQRLYQLAKDEGIAG